MIAGKMCNIGTIFNLSTSNRRVAENTGVSTSTSSRKSDVFWAMYMDREHIRERKAKKRHTAGPGGTGGIEMPSASNRNSRTSDDADLSMIGISQVSSIPEQSTESGAFRGI